MPVMGDKEAIHRVTHAILKRCWWLVFLLSGIMVSALRGRLGEGSVFDFWAVLFNIVIFRTVLSSRALQMLPVPRRALAKALWKFTVGYPVVVVAELSVIHAVCCSLTGDVWREAWGGAACSFSWFLLLDGASFTALALAFVLLRGISRHKTVVPKGWTERLKPDQVLLLVVAPLAAWFFIVPAYLDGPQTGVMEFNLIAGGVVFAASYLIRNKLISEHPGSASAAALSTGSGQVWSTPGWEPWRIALLKHVNETIFWSATNGFLTISACALVMEFPREHPFHADVLLGMIASAAVLNICLAWGRRTGELRAWRMLPLGRSRLGAAVVGILAAASVLPWALAFAVIGLVLVSKECLSFGEQFSLLGISMAIQGVLFAVLPSLFRGLDDALRAVLSILAVFLGVGGALFSVPLLVKSEPLIHIDLKIHGWAWMAAGFAILCAGMAVSAWHTSRVLRHGDCYGKATE